MDSRAFKNKIRSAIGFHMIIPVIFISLLILILLQIPVINCIFPTSMKSADDVLSVYADNSYVECTADTLYYTGYDYMTGGSVKGHYYYSLINGRCTIYVLSCKYILSLGGFSDILHNITFRAELIDNDKNLTDLLSLMAGDMNWSYDGINSCTSPIIISELAYSPVPVALMAFFLMFVSVFALVHILSLIHGIISPLNTAIFSNSLKKDAPVHLAAAGNEISDSIHAAPEFYMTRSYFINTVPYNMVIIPYDSIRHVYYYNTLHGLPMRRHLAASMVIVTKRSRFRFRHIAPDTAVLITNTLIEKNPSIRSGLPTAAADTGKNIS